MQIGVVGLGRMGGNIARRLMRAGHSCVVFDANPKAATHPRGRRRHGRRLARGTRAEARRRRRARCG